jgi:hypothetical protein
MRVAELWITCNESVGTGGGERRALLMLDAVAVVADDHIIKCPASLEC